MPEVRQRGQRYVIIEIAEFYEPVSEEGKDDCIETNFRDVTLCRACWTNMDTPSSHFSS